MTLVREPARRRVHPIVGARTVEQLRDNLAATELTLPEELRSRLDEATAVDPGFPNDFIADTRAWVLGASALT
jgi:aryl-alcohol dehydrogenase-like predicted oxidoreductase